MTSREIVRRCIEFDNPPRIAIHFKTAPVEGRVWDETDFCAVSYAADPRFARKPGETEWTTEWGVKKRAISTPLGEAVDSPLREGLHLLDAYRFPDFEAAWRWEHLRENVDRAHAAGKYVYGSIPTLMQLSADLRGMQDWFMDHLLDPEHLARLLDRLVEIRATLIEHYAAAGVDGVITYDDMGSNDRALVSPATFRELYFARYKAAIDLLHEHGMHFIHHCCGQVRELMDMIVEAGCDVIQLDQPALMGIDWLGEHYGGRICFWNCVDVQKTMTAGDLDAIDAEALRQVSQLGSPRGGFMVKAYQQPEAIGITATQAERQYRAFKRLLASWQEHR
jgi:uroporphyrinogen decarboxylase